MFLTLLLALTDPSPVPAVRAQAPASLDSYIHGRDFPAEMEWGQQGRVRVQLDVSPQGRVLHCRIIQPSDSPLFGAAICRAMVSRARFVPARNAEGSAAPDMVTAEISWFVP